MIYTIKNEFIEVSVDTLGAHLQSIKKGDKEFLWQADPNFWGKKAPILFPSVGKIPDDKTKISGNDVVMPKHGFIQNIEFKVLGCCNDYIELFATYTQETLENYPFKFNFLVKFEVVENIFKQTYIVKNADEKEMVYGFGLHPAFNIKNFKKSEYKLKFEEKIDINAPTFTKDFLIDFKNREKILENDDILNITDDLFDLDTIIIDDKNIKKLELINEKNDEIMRFTFDGFDTLALWKPKNAEFLCIENWDSMSGINPLPENFEDNFTNKKLKPNQEKIYEVLISL